MAVRLSTTNIDCALPSLRPSSSYTAFIIEEVLPTPVPPFSTRKVLQSDRSLSCISLIISSLANVLRRERVRVSILLLRAHTKCVGGCFFFVSVRAPIILRAALLYLMITYIFCIYIYYFNKLRYLFIYLSIYLFVDIHIHVCVHIRIHSYSYIYIYIYIYISYLIFIILQFLEKVKYIY